MSRFSAVGALPFHIQRFECTQVHVQAGSLCFEKSLEQIMSFFVFLISCFVGSKTRCGDKKISVTVDWVNFFLPWILMGFTYFICGLGILQ